MGNYKSQVPKRLWGSLVRLKLAKKREFVGVKEDYNLQRIWSLVERKKWEKSKKREGCQGFFGRLLRKKVESS